VIAARSKKKEGEGIFEDNDRKERTGQVEVVRID
jgi:hypothetical protein